MMRGGLTPREQEVLLLMMKGLSAKMISRHLDLAVPTCRTHLRNIYLKLDVDGKKQAIEYGLVHLRDCFTSDCDDRISPLVRSIITMYQERPLSREWPHHLSEDDRIAYWFVIPAGTKFGPFERIDEEALKEGIVQRILDRYILNEQDIIVIKDFNGRFHTILFGRAEQKQIAFDTSQYMGSLYVMMDYNADTAKLQIEKLADWCFDLQAATINFVILDEVFIVDGE